MSAMSDIQNLWKGTDLFQNRGVNITVLAC
ncbi:hypothetical protein SAMN05443529_13311 [Desulfosporosinus hippei DSM 8344]|uniref:Uncharacterized protein n=1 Tax=Desulfosporosinus hippei DSM 8344 TaxID=1121419 RepID=A0A1G8JJJ3_9FIRM|nr:hypothetical protein SAMN05443529_13311 [Desulfosporosinus hippei DSM 8344]